MTLSLLRSIGGTLLSRLGRKTMTFFIASIKQDDLLFLAQLAEEGKLTPVVDRTYPLADVPDAVRYLETEHARGKVVIAV